MNRTKMGIVGFVAAMGFFLAMTACKKSSSSSGAAAATTGSSTIISSTGVWNYSFTANGEDTCFGDTPGCSVLTATVSPSPITGTVTVSSNSSGVGTFSFAASFTAASNTSPNVTCPVSATVTGTITPAGVFTYSWGVGTTTVVCSNSGHDNPVGPTGIIGSCSTTSCVANNLITGAASQDTLTLTRTAP